MSGADFGNFAQIGSLILSAVVWIHTIVVSRSKASDNRVKEVEVKAQGIDARVGGLENKIVGLEAKMTSVPQTNEMHEMDVRLTELMGNLKVLTERIKPIAATMERLQEYLAVNAAENIKNPRRSRSDT